MKNSVKVSFLALLAMLLYSTTFSQVSVDYDRTVDFSKYKTFSFAGWQNDSDKLLQLKGYQSLYRGIHLQYDLV